MKNNHETIVIGIGSNLGDRLAYIQKALGLLQPILSSIRHSAIVESAAHLLPGSAPEWDLPYLNCAVAGHTTLTPRELLRALKKIEEEMGSVKTARWAPRKIDLDILAYGDCVVEEEDLTIPHKELLGRPFALFPLGQLLPYWRYPLTTSPFFNKTALELMHTLSPNFHRTILAKPYLVGVLNLTPDSFSDGGLYMDKAEAIAHAKQLWESGASFVDVGAASTRPGAATVSFEEEWNRLEPVLAELKDFRLSVDTYCERTAIQAIEEFDVELINFVGPQVGKELAAVIEKKGKYLLCMHSESLPPTRSQVLPFEKDPIISLFSWAEQTIHNLEQLGLDRKRLIIDPGIGFGKTAAQNLIILKRIKELKKIGVPLLVGHSRKSFMRSFTSKEPRMRDWQSAALAIHLMDAGVDYLRVHDVDKHMELLVAHQALSVGEEHDTT